MTGLGDGKSVPKHHPRIRCLGAVDELNSHIGASIVVAPDKYILTLKSIQNDLFNLGGELSLPGFDKTLLEPGRIAALEKDISELNSQLPPLKEFILPGGDEFSSRLHIARTVCRRSESELSQLSVDEKFGEYLIPYLNRLSDFLFVLARYHNSKTGESESVWEHPG